MQLDVLRELQRRGGFVYEIFPGAQASDAWQRQRDQHSRAKWSFARVPHDVSRMTVHKYLTPRTPTEEPGADARIREF